MSPHPAQLGAPGAQGGLIDLPIVSAWFVSTRPSQADRNVSMPESRFASPVWSCTNAYQADKRTFPAERVLSIRLVVPVCESLLHGFDTDR